MMSKYVSCICYLNMCRNVYDGMFMLIIGFMLMMVYMMVFIFMFVRWWKWSWWWYAYVYHVVKMMTMVHLCLWLIWLCLWWYDHVYGYVYDGMMMIMFIFYYGMMMFIFMLVRWSYDNIYLKLEIRIFINVMWLIDHALKLIIVRWWQW